MGKLLPFDLHDTLKSLQRSPGYALIVILTLALTIGATTAVFSIVDGVLLKPLAYRESHRLVSLQEVWQQFAAKVSSLPVNEQHFEYWRTHAQSFESMAQYIPMPANLTGSGDAAQITVVHASGSLFDVLQVPASIGRTLTPDDERSTNPAVAVLADAFWRQRFGADRGVVGRSLVLDGRPHTIVGVMPADFRLPVGARLSDTLDAFVPIRMDEERVGWVGDHNNAAIGRLKAGADPNRGQAELDVLQQQISVRATDQAHEPVTLTSYVSPLSERIVGRSRQGLLLLLGAIGAVLLIACSNLANLSLTRAVGQQRDAAIRSALGASQGRLVRKAIVEQLILSTTGGALGLWVAWIALAIFVRTAPIDLPRVNEVSIDGSVVLFTVAVSLLAGALVAMLPALKMASVALQDALRASGKAATGDRGATRTRATLLALQVALSVMLVVVTALLSVSFIRLMNVDRGFDADRVLTVGISMPASRYADEHTRLAAYDRLLASVQALPGVQGATTSSMLPLAGEGQVSFVVAEGDRRPRREQPTANFRFIAPEYFKTLGLTVLHGRAFGAAERDPNRQAPVLISGSVAARLWPGQDALGKRFSRGEADEQAFEVVGIVADARTTSIETAPPLMVYVPYWWRSRSSMSLLVRTSNDPTELLPGIRRVVREIDPEIAVGLARPLDQIVDAAFAARRYQVRLFVAFGVVALLIAMVGVYAVTAYGISRRRREMNIRVALGAQASQVLSMVVRQGSVPILAGVAAGAGGAIAIGGIVASLLFDVRARDPLVIATIVALVAGVGVLACLLAARASLTLNPAAALRDE